VKTKKEDLSRDGLREIERKIEAGLASARRGDLIEGDEVMFELREENGDTLAGGS
jgi:predicted transcriptional regulator